MHRHGEAFAQPCVLGKAVAISFVYFHFNKAFTSFLSLKTNHRNCTYLLKIYNYFSFYEIFVDLR